MNKHLPKLIINIDDFGPSSEVSQRTLAAFKASRVTRASALVNHPWPCGLAEQVHRSSIPLGIHLNISSGRSVCAKNLVPSLVDESGVFLSKNISFNLKHIEEKHLRKEFEAQIELAPHLGFQPSHLDNHRPEIYLHPNLFSICIELAKKYSIPLRNPLRGMNLTQLESISKTYGLGGSKRLLALQCHYDQMFRQNNIVCADTFINDTARPGFLSYFDQALKASKGPIIELCVHLEGNIGAQKQEFLMSKYFEKIVSRKLEIMNSKHIHR